MKIDKQVVKRFAINLMGLIVIIVAISAITASLVFGMAHMMTDLHIEIVKSMSQGMR